MQGKNIENTFETLFYACQDIRDCGVCYECPLKNFCLEDPEMSCNDFAEISASTWDEFLNYAEHAEATDEIRRSEYADMMRKIEIEERMIDDEYSG